MKRSEPYKHMVKVNKRPFEYPIVDVYRSLAGKEVAFELHWEHMPVVGPILKYKIPLSTAILPTETSQPTKLQKNREIDYEEDW